MRFILILCLIPCLCFGFLPFANKADASVFYADVMQADRLTGTGADLASPIPLPSNSTTQLLVVVFAVFDANGVVNALDTPAGWATLPVRTGGGFQQVFYRIGNGATSEIFTASDVISKYSYSAATYNNVNLAAPINAYASSFATDTSHPAPSVTTTVDRCLIIVSWTGAQNKYFSGALQFSQFVITDRAAVFGDNDKCGLLIADTFQETAGATGTFQGFSNFSHAAARYTIALAPAISLPAARRKRSPIISQ